MLPWQLSDWSTNDALRALGLNRSKFSGTVFACNQYLYTHGHIERMPGPLTWHDEQLTEAAIEKGAL